MKHLGNILHLANSGKLIVRSEQMPPAHAFVYTNDKQKIGKVYNVFGPVKNPYVAVSLFKSVNRRDLESRIGEKLYVSTKKELEKSKAKNSKNRKKSKNKSFKNKNSKDKRSKSNNRKNKSKRFNQKNKR
ncbi:MAG: Gar1/Naf1 family protein [Methanobrevibacter sp.]|nr:Gar1/Naf1 family protein [Methanobrevibacter sp.]